MAPAKRKLEAGPEGKQAQLTFVAPAAKVKAAKAAPSHPRPPPWPPHAPAPSPDDAPLSSPSPSAGPLPPPIVPPAVLEPRPVEATSPPTVPAQSAEVVIKKEEPEASRPGNDHGGADWQFCFSSPAAASSELTESAASSDTSRAFQTAVQAMQQLVTKGGSGRGPHKHRNQDDTGKLCTLCPEPAAPSHARCWTHKRAWDCIAKQCKRGFKKGKPMEEQPEAYQQWVKIFGVGKEGPPDKAIADKVVLDFCKENPEGLVKNGQKRGSVNLTSYIHSRAQQLSDTRSSNLCIWDEEVFLTQMKLLRGWSPLQAKQQWDALERQPELFIDMKGPPRFPKRLLIPANLTGTEQRSLSSTDLEERRISIATKAAERSSEDQQRMISELRTGFDMRPQGRVTPDHIEALHEPLAAGALTAGPAAVTTTPVELVQKAAALLMPETSQEAGASSDPDPGAAGTPGAPSTSDGAAAGAVALPGQPKSIPAAFESTRNKKTKSMEMLLEGIVTKVTDSLKQGAVMANRPQAVDHQMFLNALTSKLAVAAAFLGVGFSVVAIGDQGSDGHESGSDQHTAVLTDLATQEADGTPAMDAKQLDAHFQQALGSCEFLPMESKDLPCHAVLLAELTRAKGLQTPQDMEQCEAKFQAHVELARQLQRSLATAVADLKNAMAAAERKAAKAKAAALKAAAAATGAEAAKSQAAAAASQAAPGRGIFQADKRDLCIAVRTFAAQEGLNNMRKEDKGDELLVRPWLLGSSDLVGSLLAPGTQAGSTVDRWCNDFPNSKICKQHGSVIAPFLDGFGGQELVPLWDFLVPRPLQAQPKTPVLQQLLKDAMLCGFKADFVDASFEAQLCAMTYFNIKGHISMVLAHGAQVLKHLKDNVFAGKDMSLPAVADHLTSCSAADLRALSDTNNNMLFCNLPAKAAIFVPPGYILCLNAGNGGAACIKKAFVLDQGSAMEQWKQAAEAMKANAFLDAKRLSEVDGVLDRVVLG